MREVVRPGRTESPRGHAPAAPPQNPILELQAAVGNRAVGQVLARKPYDQKLVDGAGVIQPPIVWIHYPPTLLKMSRVELFDAMVLIERWSQKHPDSPFKPKLKPLLKQMRDHARTVTTPAEYSTFRKYTKVPPERLKEGYERLVNEIWENGATDWSLTALEEVARDRFPGEKWVEQASETAFGAQYEMERRDKRFGDLRWYQKASFEKRSAQAQGWSKELHSLWRELSWQWINLRDTGHSNAQAEARVEKMMLDVYEKVLRAADEAIQAECKRHLPVDTMDRIRRNISNAYGDPCKPWFGANGTHGYDELKSFSRTMRAKRDDDPFSCVYYWVEEYRRRFLLLTDPEAQLADLRRQAAVGWAMHLVGVTQMSLSLMRQSVLPAISRRLGTVMRNVTMGVHLSIGEIGGTGAEVGKGPRRPPVVMVGSSSGSSGARPPKPSTPQVRVTAPSSEQPDLPRPAPSTPGNTAAKPGADRPAGRPGAKPSAKEVMEKAPPSQVLTAPPGSAYADAGALRRAVRAALAAVTDRVNVEWPSVKADIKKGLDDTKANRIVMKLAERVWNLVRNKKAIEDLIVAVWEKAARDQTTTEVALRRMAGGERLPTIDSQVDFEGFRQMLLKDLPFIDHEFGGPDNHGAYTHAFQFVLVAVGLGSPGAEREWRHALAESTGPSAPMLNGAQRPFWSRLYDAIYDAYRTSGEDPINTPEVLGPILHEFLGLPGPSRPTKKP